MVNMELAFNLLGGSGIKSLCIYYIKCVALVSAAVVPPFGPCVKEIEDLLRLSVAMTDLLIFGEVDLTNY